MQLCSIDRNRGLLVEETNNQVTHLFVMLIWHFKSQKHGSSSSSISHYGTHHSGWNCWLIRNQGPVKEEMEAALFPTSSRLKPLAAGKLRHKHKRGKSLPQTETNAVLLTQLTYMAAHNT